MGLNTENTESQRHLADSNQAPIPTWVLLLCGVWLVAISFGLVTIVRYSGTPGRSGSVLENWPQSVGNPPNQRPKILLFLHPRCACSTATVNEMAKIVSSAKNHFDLQFVFVQPESKSETWLKTALWRKAQNFPRASTLIDPTANLATKFRVYTSGHVLLYDMKGSLQFSGGITCARSHEGPSIGQDAILALLNGKEPKTRTSQVFGCGLKSQSN